MMEWIAPPGARRPEKMKRCLKRHDTYLLPCFSLPYYVCDKLPISSGGRGIARLCGFILITFALVPYLLDKVGMLEMFGCPVIPGFFGSLIIQTLIIDPCLGRVPVINNFFGRPLLYDESEPPESDETDNNSPSWSSLWDRFRSWWAKYNKPNDRHQRQPRHQQGRQPARDNHHYQRDRSPQRDRRAPRRASEPSQSRYQAQDRQTRDHQEMHNDTPPGTSTHTTEPTEASRGGVNEPAPKVSGPKNPEVIPSQQAGEMNNGSNRSVERTETGTGDNG